MDSTNHKNHIDSRYSLLSQHRSFTGREDWSGWHMLVMQQIAARFNEFNKDRMDVVWMHPQSDEYKNQKGIKFLDQQSIIEDNHTGKFWVLNYQDRQNPAVARYKDLLDNPDLQCVLRIMYDPEADYGDKVRPWFYFAKDPIWMDENCDKFRGSEKTEKLMFFKGAQNVGGRKHILKIMKDKAPDLVNKENGSTSRDDYFSMLSSAYCCLGLMGVAHACHREIESFAVGTPVIHRPYRNLYHEPLIPNVHYICAECSRNCTIEDLVDAFIYNFKRIKNNESFFNKVSQNAIDWYDRNIRYPNGIDKTIELLGIN